MIKKVSAFILYFCSIAVCQAQNMDRPQPAFDFLINYPNVRDFTMNSDGSEAYFTLQNPLEELAVIVQTIRTLDQWSIPSLVSFTGNFRDIEPSLSPDGLRLYFSSDRPLSNQNAEPKDYDIWYVERKDLKSVWSTPIRLESPINSGENEFYPCVTKNGNLYFCSDREGSIGKDDIFFAPWEGSFSNAHSLSEPINSPGMEFNAYVDPDEKYMIYTAYAWPGGSGSGDLRISYRNEDETWGESINLGTTINSRYMDYCPFVDAKTKTLYYTSRRSDVSNHHFSNAQEFVNMINQYENGFSRMYKINIEGFVK